MIYEVKNNTIYVYDKTQFNPKHILECGQVFRYGLNENNNYFVISKNNKATIIEHENFYEIQSNNTPYFINYFDLNVDYNEIKNSLKKDPILSPMIDYGYGIRILKADPLEIIISFTISQNNNIKRIQKIIEQLCVIGKKESDYNSFPTIEELSSQNLEFFQSLGAGYRDKFLFSLSQTLKNTNLNEIQKFNTDQLYDWLLSLKGVGPKVASCILLFGFGRKNKFPVDTWIEQVYYNHFSSTKRSRPQIQSYFEEKFKDYSGLAQQYLFYFEREKDKD